MLNIISSLGSDATKDNIGLFNATVAWYLHEEFEKQGYPNRLVCDLDIQIPYADNTLVISGLAMLNMRNKPRYRNMVRRATGRKLTVYRDSDFAVGYPYNRVFTIAKPSRPGYVYAGWGADSEAYYPDQKEKAVFLDRRHTYNKFPAEMASIYRTYLKVLPKTGAKIYQPPDNNVPTQEWQEMFRRSHYYCCTQYGNAGLTRIEAATCGALLVVPQRLYMPKTMGTLAHAIWKNEAELKKILNTKTDPKAISAQAMEHTWDKAASRIIEGLK